MKRGEANITYIGGPTALLEVGGLRLLTDPGFDPAETEYKTDVYTLYRISGPAVSAASLGRIDAVLLSHDHHFDNLDHSGRALLPRAVRVLTTEAGAERLGGNAVGLAHWQQYEIPTRNGRVLRITGTPARHGPPNGDRGPVTGFVLEYKDEPGDAIYVSGDTVWYEGVAEVARRFDVSVAVLFMGAARVKEVGPQHLTMTAKEGVHAAHAFPKAIIVPLHFEGWAHFSESQSAIERTFRKHGLADRLAWFPAGIATPLLDRPAKAA
ncbi:MAG: MBL fold metallo-hydrolase [Candidatus Korobacteraceae bacterium]